MQPYLHIVFGNIIIEAKKVFNCNHLSNTENVAAFSYRLLISTLPYMYLWRNRNELTAQWCHVTTLFDMPRRKVWSLSVGISNLATWQSTTLPDKGFTIAEYPIGIKILALISVMAIMHPIRMMIYISRSVILSII